MTCLIDSGAALEIIRTVRPRAARASLQALRNRGLITPVEIIHTKRFRYDPDEVRKVTLHLADLDGLDVDAVAAKLGGGAA